jgi:hypothetical protein
MKNIFTKALSEKRGGVLVFFALSLVALTAMVGLALDAAHLYGVKSQLQVAADAAALAGANELTGSSAADMTNNATTAAINVAAANYADVDPNTGQPKAVVLLPGDISIGNWDPSKSPAFSTARTPMNAVEVIAKRTGASADQPMVQNGFIKVLSLVDPGSFNQTGVIARAIAQRTKLGLAPIAVNEYWGNSYPYSYMRATDIDPAHTAGYAGQTFAFFGANANPNTQPKNTDGYVDLLYRNDRYDGTGNWFMANNTGSGACSSVASTGAPKQGTVDNDKMGSYFNYLFTGITDVPNASIVPAMAVPELYNNDYPKYPPNSKQPNYYVYPTPTSASPYATVAYFSTGGNLPTVPQGPGGGRFCDQYPPDVSKLLVMVYDGIVQTPKSASDVVTVIGYGVVQVDGYSSGSGKNPSLGSSGNTAYGHAIPHGIAGQADPYLIQLPAGATCTDLMQILAELQQNFPAAKLVDSNEADMHYGMTTH